MMTSCTLTKHALSHDKPAALRVLQAEAKEEEEVSVMFLTF